MVQSPFLNLFPSFQRLYQFSQIFSLIIWQYFWRDKWDDKHGAINACYLSVIYATPTADGEEDEDD